MQVKWHPEAEKEFLELEKPVQVAVEQHKDQLTEKGLAWEKVGPVLDTEIGLEAFRLRVDSETDERVNHRIIFDVEETCYVIYKVGRRRGFYKPGNLDEARKRKKEL